MLTCAHFFTNLKVQAIRSNSSPSCSTKAKTFSYGKNERKNKSNLQHSDSHAHTDNERQVTFDFTVQFIVAILKENQSTERNDL